MQIRSLMLAASVMCLAGCVIGQNAAEWQLAKGPSGATVKLGGPTQTLSGELLEVRDDGVVVESADGKIVFAPFTTLHQLEVTEPAAAYVNSSDPQPGEAARLRLKVVSHFPQGMTADIRARMLARAGQTELEVLR